jgi:hypothetical protein
MVAFYKVLKRGTLTVNKLTPALQQEIDDLHMDPQINWEIMKYDAYEVNFAWAANMIQQLKLLYASDPAICEQFVKDWSSFSPVFPDSEERTCIGTLRRSQIYFIVCAIDGVDRSGNSFIERSLRQHLYEVLGILV